MKKKVFFLILFMLVLVLAGIGVIGVQGQQSNKIEKEELEKLYYTQNTAFELCSNLNERKSYHGADELRLNRIAVDLYVFNSVQTEYKVTVDEVASYLAEENDADGKPRVYSVPSSIKEYIDWYIYGGEDIVWNFGKGFNKYLLNANNTFYWDIDYSETVAALEKYKNDPDYVPPEESR